MTPTDKKLIAPDLPSFADRMHWLFKQDKNISFVVLNTVPLKFKDKEPSVVKGLVHSSEFQGDNGGIHPISIPCDSVEELLMFLKNENKDFKMKPVKEIHSSETSEVFVSTRVQLKLSNAHYQVLYAIEKAREEEHRKMLSSFKSWEKGDYAVTADQDDGIEVLDISNPTKSDEISPIMTFKISEW